MPATCVNLFLITASVWGQETFSEPEGAQLLITACFVFTVILFQSPSV